MPRKHFLPHCGCGTKSKIQPELKTLILLDTKHLGLLLKSYPFLWSYKIRGNIVLHYSTSRYPQLKTIACNAHYEVVALTLRHFVKRKTCLTASLSNATSQQNSQTAHKNQPNFPCVSFLPETYFQEYEFAMLQKRHYLCKGVCVCFRPCFACLMST